MFCLASSFTFGQYTIAYVDADEVIKAMPEYRVVKNELETFQKQLLKELDEEKKSIAKFYTEVIEKVKQGALTPKQQQDAEAELQERQVKLEEKTNNADRKLVAKERALSKPMYDKFESAIKKVAKNNNYAYIMDKKFVMYAGGADATEKLKKAVGAR